MYTSETILVVSLVVGTLLTFNSDLEKVYNKVSKFLFGKQTNICRY